MWKYLLGAALAVFGVNARDATLVNINDGALGFAYCTNRGEARAYISESVVGTQFERWVVRHERRHRADFEAYGCKNFTEMQNSAQLRLDLEVRAYCDSIEAAQEPPLSWSKEQSRALMATYLSGYDFGLTVAQADSLLMTSCG